MLLARRILYNIMNVKQETLYYMFRSTDGDSSSFLATTGEASASWSPPPNKPHQL